MRSIFAAAVMFLLVAATASAEDEVALSAEGKALIQKFGGALKAELVAAMEDGGPFEAISVCNVRAPEIAAAISADSGGWTISRSSHKLRNPNNAPDPYTAAAIEAFLARETSGEVAANMVKAEIVEEDGQRVFRMVKAIPTGAVCLTCHGGDEVTLDVKAALAALYPDDMAHGFKEGEMRGVFTLRKVID